MRCEILIIFVFFNQSLKQLISNELNRGIVQVISYLVGRSWLGSRIFTFGNVSRDASLIIGQSGLIFFHYIQCLTRKLIFESNYVCNWVDKPKCIQIISYSLIPALSQKSSSKNKVPRTPFNAQHTPLHVLSKHLMEAFFFLIIIEKTDWHNGSVNVL